MASRDLHNRVHQAVALNPATVSSSATTSGNVIDTQGYESAEFVLTIGTVTDGTYTPSLQEGDSSTLSDAATVASTDLLGTYAGAALTASNTAKRVGYKGGKRYVRLQVVSTAVTTGATSVGAVVLLGHPRSLPTT